MFSDETKRELKKKLDPKHVNPPKQNGPKGDYLEGWFVEETANRIFGFDGWTSEILDLIENTSPTQNQRQNWVVSFRAQVRITAKGIVKEGIGFGSGISKDIHDAYEGAIKEAETDAEKRAFKKFGNQFGLALYDKSRANVGVDELTEQEQKEEFEANWISKRKDGPRLNENDSKTLFETLKLGFSQCDNMDDFDTFSKANVEEISTLLDAQYVSLIWISKETKQRLQHG